MFYIEETLSDGTTVRMAEGFETAEEAHDYFTEGYWRERAGSARIKREVPVESVSTAPASVETAVPVELRNVRASVFLRDGFTISEPVHRRFYGVDSQNQSWVRVIGKRVYLFDLYKDGGMTEYWLSVSVGTQDSDGMYWDTLRDAPLSTFAPESPAPEYNVPSEYTTDFTAHTRLSVGDIDSGNVVWLEVEVVGEKVGTEFHHYARQDFKWRIVADGVIVIGGTYTSKATPLAAWDVASRVVESLTLENYKEDEYIPFHHSVSRESRDWVYRAQDIFTHPHGIV